MESVEKSYTLRRPDGSEVTAQEVYDAYMSGTVRLDDGAGGYPLIMYMQWFDTNSSKNDPTDVGLVAMLITMYQGSDAGIAIYIGDKSLIPKVDA